MSDRDAKALAALLDKQEITELPRRPRLRRAPVRVTAGTHPVRLVYGIFSERS
jgi:hypothetical protein